VNWKVPKFLIILHDGRRKNKRNKNKTSWNNFVDVRITFITISGIQLLEKTAVFLKRNNV
jgi:hypothetical protein